MVREEKGVKKKKKKKGVLGGWWGGGAHPKARGRQPSTYLQLKNRKTMNKKGSRKTRSHCLGLKGDTVSGKNWTMRPHRRGTISLTTCPKLTRNKGGGNSGKGGSKRTHKGKRTKRCQHFRKCRIRRKNFLFQGGRGKSGSAGKEGNPWFCIGV